MRPKMIVGGTVLTLVCSPFLLIIMQLKKIIMMQLDIFTFQKDTVQNIHSINIRKIRAFMLKKKGENRESHGNRNYHWTT